MLSNLFMITVKYITMNYLPAYLPLQYVINTIVLLHVNCIMIIIV